MSVLSRDIIERLANHPEELMRRIVAADPDTPQDLIVALAQDPSKDVRARAGLNEKASIEVLFLAANDPEPAVRAALAHFRGLSLPPEIFSILETDTHPLVAERVLAVKLAKVLQKHYPLGKDTVGEADSSGDLGYEEARTIH